MNIKPSQEQQAYNDCEERGIPTYRFFKNSDHKIKEKLCRLNRWKDIMLTIYYLKIGTNKMVSLYILAKATISIKLLFKLNNCNKFLIQSYK